MLPRMRTMHIISMGDSEDTATSGKTDKLMTALENDPDSVIDFMKQLTSGLYTALDKQMKGTNLRSTYTIYNDKQMASEYSNYTTLIKQWEKRSRIMKIVTITSFQRWSLSCKNCRVRHHPCHPCLEIHN